MARIAFDGLDEGPDSQPIRLHIRFHGDCTGRLIVFASRRLETR